MAHHKRKTRRHGATAREHSSDYVYPRIEKGRGKRSRYSIARWVSQWNHRLKEYKEEYRWV